MLVYPRVDRLAVPALLFRLSGPSVNAMNAAQNSDMAELAVAPTKAAERVAGSSESAPTISMPLTERTFGGGAGGVACRPRTRHEGEAERKVRATKPP